MFNITKKDHNELSEQVSGKKELNSKETTYQAKYYTPAADIFEDDNAITLDLEVPGVNKDNASISLDKGILTIDAKIDIDKYKALRPIYTEYNVGHYTRRFEISERIDSEKISASVKDGILSITLPKGEEAKPRKIEVK